MNFLDIYNKLKPLLHNLNICIHTVYVCTKNKFVVFKYKV